MAYIYSLYIYGRLNVHHIATLIVMQLQEIQKDLGNRIRELRQKKGWSQEEFADRCEVHRSFMGVIERGQTNFTLSTLYKVAAVLETTVSTLLKGIV